VAGSRAPTTFCILSLMNTLSGCLLMGFVTAAPVTRRQIYCQYLCAPPVIPDAVEISHSDASVPRARCTRDHFVARNSEGDGRISTSGEQSAVSIVRYRMLRLSSSSSRVSSVLDETRRARMRAAAKSTAQEDLRPSGELRDSQPRVKCTYAARARIK